MGDQDRRLDRTCGYVLRQPPAERAGEGAGRAAESFSRPFAVPTGVALIGLGLSLWRDQRRQAQAADAPATTWTAQPVTR